MTKQEGGEPAAVVYVYKDTALNLQEDAVYTEDNSKMKKMFDEPTTLLDSQLTQRNEIDDNGDHYPECSTLILMPALSKAPKRCREPEVDKGKAKPLAEFLQPEIAPLTSRLDPNKT